MPPGNVGACDDACGRAIVAWLQSLPADQSPAVCASVPPAPRQLRLLTRREYANSITDLLGAPAGRACTSDATCTIATESCGSGACATDGCGLRTFVWRANGRRPASIHVAGSFNGWPATVAAGGWAMTLVPGSDSYVVKKPLANGAHQYKFVIDGQWVVDDGNPERVSDGFGGNNSVVNVQCSGTTPPQTPMSTLVAAFPPESRPKNFTFDNNAEAGLVTSGHVEAYLDAAATVATRVTSPCRPAGADRRPCAEQFISTFGRRVFRRPPSMEEVNRYTAVVVAAADFDAGVKQATGWLLSSPHFLYRSELGATQTDDGQERGPPGAPPASRAAARPRGRPGLGPGGFPTRTRTPSSRGRLWAARRESVTGHVGLQCEPGSTGSSRSPVSPGWRASRSARPR